VTQTVTKVAGQVGSAPVSPDLLRGFLRQQPAYIDNRERAAVVLDQGFQVYDAWTKAKPAIFIGGLIGMALSGVALYKRRRTGPEAWAMYAASFAASAAATWVARPGTSTPPPPGTLPGEMGAFAVVDAIDKKRAELKRSNPYFADQIFMRLADTPGVREQLNANPLVKAAVV
jgi:hypothetical protein